MKHITKNNLPESFIIGEELEKLSFKTPDEIKQLDWALVCIENEVAVEYLDEIIEEFKNHCVKRVPDGESDITENNLSYEVQGHEKEPRIKGISQVAIKGDFFNTKTSARPPAKRVFKFAVQLFNSSEALGETLGCDTDPVKNIGPHTKIQDLVTLVASDPQCWTRCQNEMIPTLQRWAYKVQKRNALL